MKKEKALLLSILSISLLFSCGKKSNNSSSVSSPSSDSSVSSSEDTTLVEVLGEAAKQTANDMINNANQAILDSKDLHVVENFSLESKIEDEIVNKSSTKETFIKYINRSNDEANPRFEEESITKYSLGENYATIQFRMNDENKYFGYYDGAAKIDDRNLSEKIKIATSYGKNKLLSTFAVGFLKKDGSVPNNMKIYAKAGVGYKAELIISSVDNSFNYTETTTYNFDKDYNFESYSFSIVGVPKKEGNKYNYSETKTYSYNPVTLEEVNPTNYKEIQTLDIDESSDDWNNWEQIVNFVTASIR